MIREAVIRYLQGKGIKNDQLFRVKVGEEVFECKLLETGIYIKNEQTGYRFDLDDNLGQRILYESCYIEIYDL